MLAPGEVKQIPGGYRLIRNSREKGQKVIALHVVVNEIGFEFCAAIGKARTIMLEEKSKGHYVVIVSRRGRHPAFVEADEFWGFWGYHNGSMPGHLWPPVEKALRSAFGELQLIICNQDKNIKHSETIIHSSPKAKEFALSFLKEDIVVMLLPRWRPYPDRNFRNWKMIANAALGTGARVVCGTPRENSAKLDVEYLEDALPSPDDLLDIEATIHKEAACIVSGESGVQCIPIMCGCPRLLLFNGIWSFSRDLAKRLSSLENAPSYKVVDQTNVLAFGESKEVANRVSGAIQKAVKDYRERN